MGCDTVGIMGMQYGNIMGIQYGNIILNEDWDTTWGYHGKIMWV
jgi:hypothetical protein